MEAQSINQVRMLSLLVVVLFSLAIFMTCYLSTDITKRTNPKWSDLVAGQKIKVILGFCAVLAVSILTAGVPIMVYLYLKTKKFVTMSMSRVGRYVLLALLFGSFAGGVSLIAVEGDGDGLQVLIFPILLFWWFVGIVISVLLVGWLKPLKPNTD